MTRCYSPESSPTKTPSAITLAITTTCCPSTLPSAPSTSTTRMEPRTGCIETMRYAALPTALQKKKKKYSTSFCQPTRLITCAKEWQEQQAHLFAHEVKAVNNEVKDPHVILLSTTLPLSTLPTLLSCISCTPTMNTGTDGHRPHGPRRGSYAHTIRSALSLHCHLVMCTADLLFSK